MIGKSFLGESLKFLIDKLKLSYRKVSTIIGESLAAVRRGLWRGYLFGIFLVKSAMKSRFFCVFFVFVSIHFRVYFKDQPHGVVISTTC